MLKIICNINWFRGDKTGIMSTPKSNIKNINYVWLAFLLPFKILKIFVQFNNNYILVCIFTFIYLLRSYVFYSTCLEVRAYHAEGVIFFSYHVGGHNQAGAVKFDLKQPYSLWHLTSIWIRLIGRLSKSCDICVS